MLHQESLGKMELLTYFPLYDFSDTTMYQNSKKNRVQAVTATITVMPERIISNNQDFQLSKGDSI